jgi:hypothetical protein
MLILDDWVLQGDLKSVSGSPALDVNSQQKASGSKQLKRTADASFDDAEIDNKRAKLSPLHSQAETDVQGPSQQPPKTGRYAKLGGVEDTELPDYSQTTLTFASREDAVQDFKTRLKSLEKHFRSSERDTSIPQTDSERQDAVCLVFGAMKDIAHARDVNSRDFNSRWAADAKRKYSDTDLEITSWEIVVSDFITAGRALLTLVAPDEAVTSRRPISSLDTRSQLPTTYRSLSTSHLRTTITCHCNTSHGMEIAMQRTHKGRHDANYCRRPT